MNELGKLMASLMPQESKPLRCPKCGGYLTVTVCVYPRVRVNATLWAHDGAARLNATDHIVETKQELRDNVEAGIDERDEIYCEHYSMGEDGCDYWARPVDLEIELGNRLRAAQREGGSA